MTTYTVMVDAAQHVCWGRPMWDGTMDVDCPGCDQAEKNPCRFCGYGHVFTTHNPESHWDDDENTDESIDSYMTGDSYPSDEWMNSPHIYA